MGGRNFLRFSEDDFEADYSIRQAEQATSSDSEEEEMLESLECEYQPTDTVNVSLQVEDNEETKKERALVSSFVSSTCKCSFGPKKTACSAQFHAEEVTEQRRNAIY